MMRHGDICTDDTKEGLEIALRTMQETSLNGGPHISLTSLG